MSILERTSLVAGERPPIDQPLIDSLQPLSGISEATYAYLRPNPTRLTHEKAAFFADPGKTYNPNLLPEGVDNELLSQNEKQLVIWKENLLANGTLDPITQNAYRWRVNEMIANIRILQAASTGNQRRMLRYNRFIYGDPSKEIFAATADWFRSQASAHIEDEAPGIRNAAERVLDVVSDYSGDMKLLTPDPETFQRVRDRHFFRAEGYYTLLLANVEMPPEGTVKPTAGEPALRQVLQNLRADSYEVTDADSATWSVGHNPPQLERPATYSMPQARFIGLALGHEIGSHILEHINGSRQALRLLGFGLDRYESGNEGRAVTREQLVYPTFQEFSNQVRWQDIMRRHFAISLAIGVDGRPRTFSEVFQVVNAVDHLWERIKKSNDHQAADVKADERTWSLLARVLKGTDGTGGAYQKDIVYLEGHVACWKAAQKNPELIELGDLGKFDIANSRHIGLLQKLGVLPSGEV